MLDLASNFGEIFNLLYGAILLTLEIFLAPVIAVFGPFLSTF